MNMQKPSCALAILLIATQVLGPAALWSADQRGVRIEMTRRALITALSGEQLMVESADGSKPLRFRDVVKEGDRLATGAGTMAEILIGNRGVVTMGQDTTMQIVAVSSEETTLKVTKGLVRVASSAEALGEEGPLVLQTPNGQIRTHGGIVRVIVEEAGRTTALPLDEPPKPLLTAYPSHTRVAAATIGGETIQVEEGTAEIPGAGPEGQPLMVNAGQSVRLQSGQAGSVSEQITANEMRVGVLASAGHGTPPSEAVENLVALQVDQATALGQALTVAEKTSQENTETEKQDESQNAVIGTTGGVTLTSTLFGSGNTTATPSTQPQERQGGGYGGPNLDGFGPSPSERFKIFVNGSNDNALLVFTKKDPIQSDNSPLPSVASRFTVVKELLLVGGNPNTGHGGIAPTDTLIVRGAAPYPTDDFPTPSFTNVAGELLGPKQGLWPTDRLPADIGPTGPVPLAMVHANSTFVVESNPTIDKFTFFVVGGTLGQYSNLPTPSPNGIAIDTTGNGTSFVDGAITATGANVVLTGGVTLDRGTKATIGTTKTTNKYFTDLQSSDAKYDGSLLSVIHGPDGPTALTMQDRMLGVYDGSTIDMEGGDKALLSVLDAKLKGPNTVPLLDIAAGFKDADTANGPNSGDSPEVTVTSAVVTRSTLEGSTTGIPLDAALLEASAPLLALTHAKMTTESHFADLAGNHARSIRLDDALVALNASQLIIKNGHLLNLNNASATVNGFLFSLNNGSSLTIDNGALFSLNTGSTLNLNGNAFGVFGSGTNTLSIKNDLCATGCANLVNSAGTTFLLSNGSPLNVAGVTQNVVLPSGFSPFAQASGAATPKIEVTGALFEVKGGSTLTIQNTAVVN